MKIISSGLSSTERAVAFFVVVGSLLIVNIGPFVMIDHLPSEFYFFYPVLLLFSAYVISRIFMFKRVSFDDHNLTITSQRKTLVIPLVDIIDVWRFASQCFVKYQAGNDVKSVGFILTIASDLMATYKNSSVDDLKLSVNRAKRRINDREE